MDKVLIFDAMNAMHRARFPFADGKYSVVYNFFRNLRPLVEKFSPNKIYFVFEGHPKFRYDLYPAYKGNRIVKVGTVDGDIKKEKLDDFYVQSEIIIKLLSCIPCTLVKADAYEADDVIASLVNDLSQEDITVISSDTDFIQLLQLGYNNIKLYNPIKKEFATAPDYNYLAWKILAGDKTDNIPKLLSDAKALKMVTDPVSLEKFLELEENRANFSINTSLIKFANVPLEDFVIDQKLPNFEQLKIEFNSMEFSSITNEKSWDKFVSTFNLEASK